MKRLFDIAFSFTGLIVLSPLFLAVVILAKLTSKGPVFFCQKRIGRFGKNFTMYKFRSMTVLDGAAQGSFDVGNSSRVTSFGKFLRKTKIDELPQLWNVLIGDMSFVGPRPEVRKWVDAYPERWEKILQIRPGITDPASIVFRDEEEILAASDDPEMTYERVVLPKKLSLCEAYVQNRSFLGDILLIFKTLVIVITKRKGVEEK